MQTNTILDGKNYNIAMQTSNNQYKSVKSSETSHSAHSHHGNMDLLPGGDLEPMRKRMRLCVSGEQGRLGAEALETFSAVIGRLLKGKLSPSSSDVGAVGPSLLGINPSIIQGTCSDHHKYG
jgi:hypothetical protein